MADSNFTDRLHAIAARIRPDMSERDVETTFLAEDFYTALGYKGAGHDVRSELSLPDQRRPDYITLDDNERVTAIYEFKTANFLSFDCSIY